MFVSIHRSRSMVSAPFLSRSLMHSLSRMNFLTPSLRVGIRSFHASSDVLDAHRDSSLNSSINNRRHGNSDQGKSSRLFDSEVDFGIRRRGTPVMDMVELSDEPSKGSMVRAVYFGRSVELAHYPQLGPRKTDPNDPMPQFDFKQRAFYRLNKTDIASLIAICEGRIPSVMIRTRFGGTLEANMPSAEELVLKLDLPRSRDRIERMEITVCFKGHYLPTFRHFLEFSLSKSFGFDSSAQASLRRTSNPNRRNSEGESNKPNINTIPPQRNNITRSSNSDEGRVKPEPDSKQNNMFRDEIDW